MCQLEKPRGNEITEPLVFTVYKLEPEFELRGKATVAQSRFRRIRQCRGKTYLHITLLEDLQYTVITYRKEKHTRSKISS